MCPRHPNEEFDQRRHRDAPVVTPSPFSVFEFLEQYPTCFDVGRSSCMPTGGSELRVRTRPGERRVMAVAEWVKLWNHWDTKGALS